MYAQFISRRVCVVKTLEERCIEAGLKMTGQRRAILQVLRDSEDHPAVEDVYQRAIKFDKSVSIATVYRTLALLNELGLVVRHEFQSGFSRYEINHDDHYHLVDLESGDVIEFQNDTLDSLMQKIVKDYGYELVDHRFELYGRKLSK
ncbi:MAG: Fur family transcriptional regulator [Alphaproteobacteria bacterium]